MNSWVEELDAPMVPRCYSVVDDGSQCAQGDGPLNGVLPVPASQTSHYSGWDHYAWLKGIYYPGIDTTYGEIPLTACCFRQPEGPDFLPVNEFGLSGQPEFKATYYETTTIGQQAVTDFSLRYPFDWALFDVPLNETYGSTYNDPSYHSSHLKFCCLDM